MTDSPTAYAGGVAWLGLDSDTVSGCPAQVDQHSGYRYDESGQLAHVHALIGLKDLGFTLEQIRPVLSGEIERRLRLMEGSSAMNSSTSPSPRWSSANGPMFEQLIAAQVGAGEQPAHPDYAWYEARGNELAFGAGFARPIAGESSGRLAAVERAVTTTYVGPMSGIGAAWAELGTQVAARGLEPYGPCREVYLKTDGPQQEWVTELQQPVRG